MTKPTQNARILRYMLRIYSTIARNVGFFARIFIAPWMVIHITLQYQFSNIKHKIIHYLTNKNLLK